MPGQKTTMNNTSQELLNIQEKGSQAPDKEKHIEQLLSAKTPSTTTATKTKPTTFRTDASDLLTRIQNFLPLLSEANKTLEEKLKQDESYREQIDLEAVEEDAEQVIQMDLGLGVFELREPGQEYSDEDVEAEEREITMDIHGLGGDMDTVKPFIQVLQQDSVSDEDSSHSVEEQEESTTSEQDLLQHTSKDGMDTDNYNTSI